MDNSTHFPLTTRQRMINLMYLVFIALLALNVASDSREEFELLDEALRETVKRTEERNKGLYYLLQNHLPEQEPGWMEQVVLLKKEADSLSSYIQELKRKMQYEADRGKRKFRRNTNESVAHVLFSPRKGEAKHLQRQLEQYIKRMAALLPDKIYPVGRWDIDQYESKTLFVVLPFLTKMELDIRCIESEVLQTIYHEMVVNSIPATLFKGFLLPDNNPVLTGESYQGKVVIGIADTSLIRDVVFAGQRMLTKTKDEFSFIVSGEGEYALEGYADISADGVSSVRIPLKTSYHVTEPVLTIGRRGRNILYAGYPNQLQIAVPGLPTHALRVVASEGMVTKKEKNYWQIIPSLPGTDVILSVSYSRNGQHYTQEAVFNVYSLPDPTLFIHVQGRLYKGGSIDGPVLLQADKLEAGYEEGFPDTGFEVISFELNWLDSFGNRLSELSRSAGITNRQKEILRGVARGKPVWFSEIQVLGEDGTLRKLPPLQIILN